MQGFRFSVMFALASVVALFAALLCDLNPALPDIGPIPTQYARCKNQPGCDVTTPCQEDVTCGDGMQGMPCGWSAEPTFIESCYESPLPLDCELWLGEYVCRNIYMCICDWDFFDGWECEQSGTQYQPEMTYERCDEII